MELKKNKYCGDSQQIREITTQTHVTLAMTIKKSCWDDDYASLFPNVYFDVESNARQLFDWLVDPNCMDVRKMLGYYINEELIGFISASFAEEEDAIDGVEINDLFVLQTARGKYVASSLINDAMKIFKELNKKHVILYNYHHAKSNAFYTHLNGKVMKQVIQTYKGYTHLTDVFYWSLDNLLHRLNRF